MKLERNKVPYKPAKKKDVKASELAYEASKDHDMVIDMIKAGEIPQLKEFINARLAPYEEKFADDRAGLATRDYLTHALGKEILDNNPEYRDHTYKSEADRLKIAQQFKDKFYPGLDEGLKAVGLSDKMRSDPYEDNEYSKKTGLNWGIGGNENMNMGVLAHEMGHAVDYLGEKASGIRHLSDDDSKKEITKAALEKMLKKKPAYAKVFNETEEEPLHQHSSTRSEGGYSNPRIPNFSDYNWEEGDFNSDYMRDPLDIQGEQATDHHNNRNYPLDNLIDYVQGGADKVVEAPSRYSKLKKTLA